MPALQRSTTPTSVTPVTARSVLRQVPQRGAVTLLPEGAGQQALAPVDAFSSAVALLRALSLRQITASELLALHLRRIQAYDPDLQAFARLEEDAPMRARAADAARRRGYGSILSGLPLAIEAGTQRPTPPARLARKGGATLLGHTYHRAGAPAGKDACPGEHTRNPWDLAHSAGAGTSAAAVAAGLAPLVFGHDEAGRVREAAALCGIYAHRPSRPAIRRPASVTKHGPTLLAALARAAEDLELGVRVLGTADGSGAATWPGLFTADGGR